MYAGIFSDKENYECGLKRIMKRLGVLLDVYEEKKLFLARKNCNTNVNFAGILGAVENYENSGDLGILFELSEQEKNKNKYARCKVW